MKNYISILLSLFVLNNYAQDFNNYVPLASSGEIPSDFTAKTFDKVQKDLDVILDNGDSYKDRENKTNFILKSNYMIDELLMSGRILFGDPVSDYVNKVADKLLENEPKLRSKLRFYCLKSNITNAFSTNQGMIFVTLGLISQLENEAQLAQVLAHEITHYTKKHVINTFLETSRINRNSGNYKYNNYDDNIIKLSNFSKSLEFEADSLGYFRLKDAGYKIKEALSVFDILQFSYLPFEEEVFQFDMFETDVVKIPEEFKLDTVMQINFIDDYDDSKSTHPNIKKRRKKIQNLIANAKGGKVFIQSKEEFIKVRTICRFESIRINNKDAAYVKAIYNAQILLKKYPESDFLKRNILKSLYGLSKYKLNNKYYKIAKDYEDHEGEISAAYYLFEKLEDVQIAALTIEKLNNYYLQHKEDEYIKSLMLNLIEDLVQEEDYTFKEFYKLKHEDDSIGSTDSTVVEEEVNIEKIEGKYAKLRAIQKQQVTEGVIQTDGSTIGESFHHEYLYNASNKDELNQFFADAISHKKEDSDSKYDDLSYYEKNRLIKKEQKEKKKNDKLKDKNIYAYKEMQTDKIIFVDPDYFIADSKRGQKLKNAEQKKYELYQQIETVATKVGIDYEILSPKAFEVSEVSKYNDLATINNWISEKMMHFNVIDDWNMIVLESDYTSYLTPKYGTNTFVYSGVYQINKTTYLYYLWYDLEQGKFLLEKVIELNTKAKQVHINSQLYNILSQVKK